MQCLPSFCFSRAAVAGFLVAQILWVLALAGVPALHEWVHSATEHGEHSQHGSSGPEEPAEHPCVVTLFVSGACDCAPEPVQVVAPELEFRTESNWFEPLLGVSLFRFRGILEHAPPRCIRELIQLPNC